MDHVIQTTLSTLLCACITLIGQIAFKNVIKIIKLRPKIQVDSFVTYAMCSAFTVQLSKHFILSTKRHAWCALNLEWQVESE